MKVEIRRHGDRADLVLIAEEDESLLIDEVFGDQVGAEGLIWQGTVECRLSDGFRDHYLLLKGKHA